MSKTIVFGVKNMGCDQNYNKYENRGTKKFILKKGSYFYEFDKIGDQKCN